MTRFIPSEEIDSLRVQHWHFGSVKDGAQGFSVMPEMMTDAALHPEPVAEAAELLETESVEDALAAVEVLPEPEVAAGIPEEEVQRLVEQARQEAFQQGVAQGEAKTSQSWQARMSDYQNNIGRDIAQRLNEVLNGANTAVQGLQQSMAPDLLQLASDIARQVVRQELRCNPQALLPVVREALEMLSADTKPAVVRLNPKDFEHLSAHLREALPNPKVEWLADAGVAEGGCVVESQGAQVDGSIERRWQRAVAALGLVSTWYDGASHGN